MKKKTVRKKAKKSEPKTIDTTVDTKAGYMPRHREKYPALNFRRATKIRREVMEEIDYVSKLSDEEKAWLNSFLEETVVTNFQHKGKKLIRNKEGRRKAWRENNARNRDMLGQAKATGMALYCTDADFTHIFDKNTIENPSDTEDAFITALDNRHTVENELELSEKEREHLLNNQIADWPNPEDLE